MANHRTLGITAFATLLAILFCVTLMGFESSLLSERLVYFQQADSTSKSSLDANIGVTSSSLPTIQKAVASEAPDNSAAMLHSAVGEVTAADKARLEASKKPEQSKQSQSATAYELNELMTPELVHKIETQENSDLSPVQVHLIWIGDLSKAPSDRLQYTQKGYNLTVHTSAEEILDGFHPHVLNAYQHAIPKVVGYDFLKFALLYKYGGFAVDADTSPTVLASELQWPSDCDLIFGKEASAQKWEKPVFRKHGGPEYGLIRPFQVLNWAMAASKPRNPHIKWMLQTAMMHFFGLRDMEATLIQDISGSGLMTDYVALLHEKEGRSYREVFNNHEKYYPVEGLCLTDGFLRGEWIQHSFLGSWKRPDCDEVAKKHDTSVWGTLYCMLHW